MKNKINSKHYFNGDQNFFFVFFHHPDAKNERTFFVSPIRTTTKAEKQKYKREDRGCDKICMTDRRNKPHPYNVVIARFYWWLVFRLLQTIWPLRSIAIHLVLALSRREEDPSLNLPRCSSIWITSDMQILNTPSVVIHIYSMQRATFRHACSSGRRRSVFFYLRDVPAVAH